MNYAHRIASLIAIIFCSTVCSGLAQVRERINEKNVQLAEEWATEISALPAKLPERWATRQVRMQFNTAQLAELKVHETFVEEIAAKDGDKAAYTKYSAGSKSHIVNRTTDGLGMQVTTAIRGNRKLFRIQKEDWQQVEKIPNIGYPSTMPFNWCVGLLTSARSGSMGEDDYLTGIFRSHNRKCLAAWRNQEADLVSFWGLPTEPGGRIPPIAMRIIFDDTTHLISEYALVYFEDGVNLENIKRQDYRFIEKGEVEWSPETVSTKPSESGAIQQLHVPVFIKVLSTMNKGEEIECENRIQWLFGDEVPDATFKDPRTSEFEEPIFPTETTGKSSDKSERR